LKLPDILELLALAALWGASFLFMRLGAADFGPVAMTWVRMALAALVLAPVAGARRWQRRCAGMVAPCARWGS
jgi:drug/metabolite transporter (DMT)-like permease